MVKLLQNIVRFASICMIAVILLFFSQFTHANTEACVSAANQLSNEIAEIFNEHGTQVQQYFTIHQNWSDWSRNNNPIIEGDTEYSYGVVMFSSENGWVITEQALNLAQETLVEDEFRQEDNDVLPERFTFPETQLIQWYEIVSQNPEWINALDNDIQDAQNLATSCNITLTVENITDGVPFTLNSGSGNNEGNEGAEEGGSEEASTPVPAPGQQLDSLTFQDDFLFFGETFYSAMGPGLSDPLSNGRYALEARFGFYGDQENMLDQTENIETGLEFKFKMSGASSYFGNLEVESVENFQEEELSNEYARIYVLNSASAGAFVDPGVYQVDVILNGTLLDSLPNICLPTFTSSSLVTIGSQQCSNASISNNEIPQVEMEGTEGYENQSEFVGPPSDPSLEFDGFGDGFTQFDVSTAITNVPRVQWGDQLVFRAITEDYNVEVFGVNVTDLQNGNASVGELIINIFEGAGQGQYQPGSAMPNLSLFDLINGELTIDDFNFPGVEIDEQEVFYDFFYDFNTQIDLNGRSYDAVRVYFGDNERRLPSELLIAEFQNASGTLVVDEQVYNARNDGNETEYLSTRLGNGRDYYVGVFGVHIDELGRETGVETIAVKRLATYSNNINDVGGIDVFWDGGPYLTPGSNTAAFDISGQVQTYNYVPEEQLDLMFGYTRQTFKRVDMYPTTVDPNQQFNFQKDFENVYAYLSDDGQFGTLPIEPGIIYYAGIYELGDLVSFQQVGRTPDYVNPPAPPTEPADPATNPAEGLFNQSPMAALEAELDTGIVPCTGLDCNYDKIIELIDRAWKFVFIMIIPIAAIAFAYAGFLLMFQGSSPEKRKLARNIFIKVFIGIAVVLSAFLLVKTILVTLGVDQANSLLDLS